MISQDKTPLPVGQLCPRADGCNNRLWISGVMGCVTPWAALGKRAKRRGQHRDRDSQRARARAKSDNFANETHLSLMQRDALIDG